MTFARLWLVARAIFPALFEIWKRKRKMPNVPSQEEFDALELRVSALEALRDEPKPKPEPKPVGTPNATPGLVDSAMLELVGGWRLPKKGVDGVGSHGLSFVGGGVHIEGDGDDKTLFTIGHNTKNKLHSLTFSISEMGTSDDQTQWPEMVPVAISDSVISGETDLGGARCTGIWGDGAGSLLTSNYCGYSANRERAELPFLTWVDRENGPVGILKTRQEKRQAFGGSFVEIPTWFAEKHCGGRSLGLFGGGKHSGQGWSLGPTLAAISKPEPLAVDAGDATVLMRFQGYDSGTTEFVERRFPDYGPRDDGEALFNFHLPKNGVGFWQADDVPAAAWVDNGDVSGLLVWSIQGVGPLDYKLQRIGMSETLKTRLYIYDPSTLASVAEGTTEPHSVLGRFEEWRNPFEDDDRQTDDRWPVGAHWDGEFLYVLYRNSAGQKLGPSPVLAVYRINSRGE